ncbi:hypothetical protein [Nostoc sp. C117]|uniref:hypothetical protein n=1 Tax=Nostoc sp. C117 TaxID=3349875 RepID=UPI00370DD2D0
MTYKFLVALKRFVCKASDFAIVGAIASMTIAPCQGILITSALAPGHQPIPAHCHLAQTKGGLLGERRYIASPCQSMKDQGLLPGTRFHPAAPLSCAARFDQCNIRACRILC